MSINYSERIPNNVDLSSDRRLQRALEAWQPNYLQWWKDMGPDGSLVTVERLAPRGERIGDHVDDALIAARQLWRCREQSTNVGLRQFDHANHAA